MRIIIILFILINSIQTISSDLKAQNLTSGLIACYSFSGNANDGTNNQHHGTVNNAMLVSDRFGIPNSAYQFNGSTSSFIRLPAEPLKLNNYSYSIWVKASSFPGAGTTAIVLSVGDVVTGRQSTINLGNLYSAGEFLGWGGGSWNDGPTLTSSAAQGAIPNLNEWYHLVLTRNNTHVKLYINSQLVGMGATNGYPAFYGSTTNAFLGVRCNFIQPYYGAVDDLSIYNREITQQEINLLFQNSLPCLSLPPIVSDVEICSGNSATILASGGNIYRWYDSPIGGTVLFEGNPFVTPILSETKHYYVSNVNGLESTREELLVTVFPNPEIICPDPVSYFTNSINFNFNVINGSSPFEFVIDFGDNTTLTTLTQTVSHTYMEDGVFDLGTIVKDVNGCVSSCETEVIIYKGIFIPNVITANKDTKNEIFNLYYILNNQYVTYNGEEDFLLEIYNRWGNKIYFTTDPVSGWNGEEVDTGTFYYNIKIGSQNFRGWIQVLR